jgi:hypothetical protein
MNCIFCKKPTDGSRLEHVLPESLGGKEWALLPRGIVCSGCNQYFGSKVEALALSSYPFLPFRLLLGIPTKHNKPPKMETALGELKSGPTQGFLGLDPSNDEIQLAIADGRISQLCILAEPTETLAVCRLLLKMGLEAVANESVETALSPKYDSARQFARSPQPSASWWFLVCTDHARLFRRFVHGITPAEWVGGVALETADIGGAEIFHLKLLDMDILTPLQPNVVPSFQELPEPDYRLFWATNE